jgi:hypothetical protein
MTSLLCTAAVLVSAPALPRSASAATAPGRAAAPACTAVWDGSASGAWDVVENWQDDVLPQAGDAVCLTSAEVEVRTPVEVATVAGGAVRLNAGGLVLSGPSRVTRLTVAGGRLDVAGALEVAGAAEQSGGEVTGAGRLEVLGDLSWSGGVQTGGGATYAETVLLPDGPDRSVTGRVVDGDDVRFTGDAVVHLVDEAAVLETFGEVRVDGVTARIVGSGTLDAGALVVRGSGDLDVEASYALPAGDEIHVSDEGRLRIASSGELAGPVRLTGNAVLELAADRDVLDVAGEPTTTLGVASGATTLDGDAQLGTVLVRGELAVGGSLVAREVHNAGTVDVEEGSLLAVTGARGYSQRLPEDDPSAAPVTAIDVDGELELRGGVLDLQKGELTGAGRVVGDLLNRGGTVAPVGDLLVAGSYEQTSAGRLAITRRGQRWDQLQVQTTARLAGRLTLPSDGAVSTTPVVVLSAAATEGEFQVLEGDLVACGDVRYADGDVALVLASCIAVEDARMAEGFGSLVFRVALTEPAAAPVRVDWATADGTARAGEDYEAGQGFVVLAPGETTASVEVPLVDDDRHEPEEQMSLRLSTTHQLLTPEAVGTVEDDDDEPVRLEPRPVLRITSSTTVAGVGGGLVVGEVAPDADTSSSWGWRIEDGVFAWATSVQLISGINEDDDVVGSCADGTGRTLACLRSRGRNTLLQHPAGTGASPLAVNADDVVVGQWRTSEQAETGGSSAVLWPDPEEAGQVIPVAGAVAATATAISDTGWIAGAATHGTGAESSSRAWVRDPETGTVTEMPALPGHPAHRYASARDVGPDGTVYGLAHNGTAADTVGFVWTPGEQPDVFDGALVDVNSRGQAVGVLRGVPTLLQPSGRTVDLRTALPAGTPWRLLGAYGVNDQGVVAAKGVDADGRLHVVALVPPGAGCGVCVRLDASQAQFPDPTTRVPVTGAVVDGNPVELSAVLRNATTTARTVGVQLLDEQGLPLGEARTLTIEPGATAPAVEATWDTAGLAWDAAGRPTAPHTVVVQVSDSVRGSTRTYERDVRVDPRPVLGVHGMNSDAGTWAAWQGFLHEVNPRWRFRAVDSMNTKPWIPGTIAENAERMAADLEELQVGTNAWHVDVVAHSMGGLISRKYVQDVMPRDASGGPVVNRVLMLGTPNAGSPCADLFDVPLTAELRTDDVARFNARVTERHGVPFSVAAGIHTPVTCHALVTGDDVVPVDSALTGIADHDHFEIAHTAMTGSHELFGRFALPRLNGTHYPTPATARTLAGETAAPAPAPAAPDLITSGLVTLEPGEERRDAFSVPSAVTSAGIALAGEAGIGLTVTDGAGTVVAELSSGSAGPWQTAPLPSPLSTQYTVTVTNAEDATGPVTAEYSVWAAGLPTTVRATAVQTRTTSAGGTVRLRASLAGLVPDPRLVAVSGTVVGPDGTATEVSLLDDGAQDDGAAGDGTWGVVLPGRRSGVHAATVRAVLPRGMAATTTSARVALVDDAPGDQPPVVQPTAIVTTRDVPVRVHLDAVDPEGAPVVFEVLAGPQHGSLTGTAPQLLYTPAAGFVGEDSVLVRAGDGRGWSEPATVTITVGRAPTALTWLSPLPAEGLKGSVLPVRARLQTPTPLTGARVELRLGGSEVVGTTTGGWVALDVPLDLPAGRHDAVLTFAGDALHAPTTTTRSVLVGTGARPVPTLPDGADAEAGYPFRVRVAANDDDRDAARVQIDLTDDGTWDVDLPADRYGVASHVHTYPKAMEGRIRVRVTDRAGGVGEHVEPLAVRPHRPLGALSLLQVDGLPARGVALSGDGGTALVQLLDTEDGTSLPEPFVVLDPQTGEHETASVLPDGAQVDFPRAGAISHDGRWVAFSVNEMVRGSLTTQTYLRDTADGSTERVSVRADGSPAGHGTTPLAVSSDGRQVLVRSTSSDYTDDDLDQCGSAVCEQVYLHDTSTHTSLLVSRDERGEPAAQTAAVAAMTPDAGTIVASADSRVVLHDRSTGTSRSLPLGGAGDLRDVDSAAAALDLSDDGRWLLLSTAAVGIDPRDTSTDLDVYRYDLQTGERVLVSVTPDGRSSAASASAAEMDGSGRRVAFDSTATDLVAARVSGEVPQVYLRDLAAGTTSLMSEEVRDHVPGRHASREPLLAGSTLLFDGEGNDLVPGDVDAAADVFHYRLAPLTGGSAPEVTVHAPDQATEGGTVTVTATATDADGDAVELTWSTDGGTLAGSGSAVTLAVGDGPAVRRVRVVASDGTWTTEAVATVTVANAPPVVSAGLARTVPWGVAAQLSGTVSDPSSDDTAAGLAPTWTFSTGGTATGTQVARAFPDPGTVTATLTATDRNGASATESVQVTVTKRPTSIRLTTASGPYGLAAVTAQPTVPLAGALAGHPVVFTVDGVAQPAVVTGADGRAALPSAALAPGTHTVTAAVAEDGRYLASRSAPASVAVTHTAGKATGNLTVAEGSAVFDAKSDGRTSKGTLTWRDAQGTVSASITSLGITTAGRTAWMSGLAGSRRVVVQLDDAGESGVGDVFRIWVDGTLRTATGQRATGNLQVHRA